MRQTLILDSSQISCYLECAQQHHLRYVENLTHSDEIREDMAAGTYGHKLLEIYYTHLAKGCDLKCAVAAVYKFHLEENFPLSLSKRADVASRFGIYWMTYSHNDIQPSIGQPIYKLSSGTNVNELVETWEPKPLVEQGFSYELLRDNTYLFVLEGRIDLIGILGGQTIWLDHKFQGRRHDLYKKSIQFRNYSLVTNLNLGVVNYIRLHKEVTKDTLVRDIISFNSYERALWREELIEIFKTILSEQSQGEPRKNRGACAGKFSIPCEFTRICEEPSFVTVEAIKNTYYKKKEVWKPW